MVLKRLFDVIISLIVLLFVSIIALPLLFVIWIRDFCSPLYIPYRVGKGGKLFRMFKLRTMVVHADKTGVDSTSVKDVRITSVGRFLRKYKLDEFMQFWNVLTGSMSLVGPRPNVKRETDLYTCEEKKLLTVKPGITDFASIVFADENEILKNSNDPNLDYNQLIRPWKSRLGLVYVDKRTFLLDLKLIILTILSFFSRLLALKKICAILKQLDVASDVVDISLRQKKLKPYPPPGTDKIVMFCR